MSKIHEPLKAMEELGMLLLIHGESPDPQVPPASRETSFIEKYLPIIIANYPSLKIVLEHISTRQAAEFVLAAPKNVAATITAHHLMFTVEDLFPAPFRNMDPHKFCCPILKDETDRQALIECATSGNPKFFLGTDSAPHSAASKLENPPKAGCFTSPAALEIYATVFEQRNALDRLEDFACRFGAEFYGLPLNPTHSYRILEKVDHEIPASLPFGNDRVIPLFAGQKISWRLSTPEK